MRTDSLFPGDDAPGIPYIDSRLALDDAMTLIRDHGDDAGYEAAIRAERSRSLGNAIHFCHWRQIERLIVLIAGRDVIGTRH